MQSVLKLMPDPIPEVPRDSSSQHSGGVHDRGGSGKFDSVYEQELYEHRQQPRDDRADQSGKDQQRMRQSDADKAAVQAKTGNDDAAKVRSSTDKVDDTADQGKAPVDGKKLAHEIAKALEQGNRAANGANPQAAQPNAQTDQDTPLEFAMPVKALDQLLKVVESAPNMLRQNNGFAVGEPHGEQALSERMARQSTLAAAIDSALADSDGGKITLEDIVKSLNKDPDAKQDGGGKNASNDPFSVKHNPTTYDLERGSNPKANGTGGVQTPGINPWIGMEEASLTGEGAGEGRLTADKLKMATGIDVLGNQGKTASNGIHGEAPATNDGRNIPKEGLKFHHNPDVVQTPGINPWADMDMEELGLKTDAPVRPAGDLLAQLGKKDGKDEKPFEVAQNKPKPNVHPANNPDAVEQGNNGKGDPNQTPGIATPKFEGMAKGEEPITRPFEQASKPQIKPREIVNDPLGATKNDTNPVTAQATADYQTKPKADKADKPFIGATGNGGNQTPNILGKATRAQLAGDAPITQEVAKAGQEGQVNERKMMETLLAQNNQQQDSAVLEEKLKSMMPKELSNPMTGKAFNPLSPTTNSFAPQSSAALNATTATSASASATAAAAEKATTQFTEALNITKPDFSANMKERLVVMMNKGVQTADIRLDPAELGQMQVKMSVENDVTSVSIVVQNAQAKEALEQTMPKLREMLAEQGLEMDEGSVEQQDQQQQELGDRDGKGGQHAAHDGDEDEQEIDPLAAQQVKLTNGALGGIDFFA